MLWSFYLGDGRRIVLFSVALVRNRLGLCEETVGVKCTYEALIWRDRPKQGLPKERVILGQQRNVRNNAPTASKGEVNLEMFTRE
jgi:hypothetical protein